MHGPPATLQDTASHRHKRPDTHGISQQDYVSVCVCVREREREHDRDPVFSASTIILISLITINPDYQSNQLK